MGIKLGTAPPDLGTAGLLEGVTGEGDPAGGTGPLLLEGGFPGTFTGHRPLKLSGFALFFIRITDLVLTHAPGAAFLSPLFRQGNPGSFTHSGAHSQGRGRTRIQTRLWVPLQRPHTMRNSVA